MGMTITQKILAEHAGKKSGGSGRIDQLPGGHSFGQ